VVFATNPGIVVAIIEDDLLVDEGQEVREPRLDID
jgi:hypothetical protein